MNIFDNNKKNYLYDRFFKSNQNFITEHVTNVKVPGFLYKLSNIGFFHDYK